MKLTDEAFWSRVRTSNGCWEWTGSLDSHGYGQAWVDGRGALAHRVAFTIAFGKPKHCVCHHCDNRRCVRPSHLFDGTKKANTEDMYRKGRGPNHRGTFNGRPKLCEDQVADIRKSESSNKTLAEHYGVSATTIWRIKTKISH